MDILQQIKKYKEQEVSLIAKQFHESVLRDRELFKTPCKSLSVKLKGLSEPAFIAEFKRKSPSKGWIREAGDPSIIPPAYEQAGAAAISVLTDEHFFGAQPTDFATARERVTIPMLRKDFIISKYQVTESKSMGADIILLIASILSADQIDELAGYARELGMEVLLEIHNDKEISSISEHITLVGINNRNLRSFEVDVDHSLRLKELLPAHLPAIAESGISGADQVRKLFKAGFKGFLIGESFMKTDDPGKACADMIKLSQTTHA